MNMETTMAVEGAMREGDVVKFKYPRNDDERDARMVVLEDRDTRALVMDLSFADDPAWTLKPKSVYPTADLEICE